MLKVALLNIFTGMLTLMPKPRAKSMRNSLLGIIFLWQSAERYKAWGLYKQTVPQPGEANEILFAEIDNRCRFVLS